MRYTRYEYKKQGKVKFVMSVVLVATVSIGSGLYISKFLFSTKETSNMTQVTQKQNETVQSQGIMALQCGYYSKKENADISIPTISSYCQPFVVEENGNYRVIAGLYDDELGMKKLDELKGKGIDVAKVSIQIPTDTLEGKKIFQIVEGFLQITSKFEESDVKSVKTADFKTWVDGIINDGNSIQSEKLKDIQSYVQSLPDEISKSNSADSIQSLYTLIKS
ncbi:SPOR domain-containing protein [Clostridium butyricum]|uniref:SPOR domain-containing protein n=1 Tax=Clostridium butyricum TaxID=1492 RepID=UPI0013D3CA2C|nr:SPOR domain-containing protein [Clostridium butyricum]MCQ2022418.1 SPOR domain-containing protein [Clostridium butyricum]NFB71280.1 SPOR domain-containing protein [Clostridium butyricum]NFB91396.1 SPOR domain-containing protein [Clostridium butyricum]